MQDKPKEEVRRCLKGWRKGRREREEYKEKRKGYKELCKGKKKKENEKWIKEIAEARKEEEIWEMNRKRRRRKGINKRIETEEWKKYFMEQMEGHGRKVILGKREGRQTGDREGNR